MASIAAVAMLLALAGAIRAAAPAPASALGGSAPTAPAPWAKVEVIHVTGTAPPPLCTQLICLPSSWGPSGLSLNRNEGPRGGPRAGVGSPSKSPKEEARPRVRECRAIWREFKELESALSDWQTFLAGLADRGQTLSTLPEREMNSAFWSLKRDYDRAKSYVSMGYTTVRAKDWEKAGCGPAPLKWGLLHKY